MPIKYNQGQYGYLSGDPYAPGDDILLSSFIQGLGAGQEAYLRRREMKSSEAYRNRQLNLQEAENTAQQNYRNELLALEKDRAKREGERESLVTGQITAATKASEASTKASEAQTAKYGAETDAARFALDLARKGEEEEKQYRGLSGYITGSIADVETNQPFALDIDQTFSDQQLIDLDPENAPKWISTRNMARSKIGDIAGRLNAIRPGSGDEFRARMEAANQRADAGVREAFARKRFNSLYNDSLFQIPSGQSNGAPTPAQAWYQQASQDVASGAKTYAEAMQEMSEQRAQAIDREVRMSARLSLAGEIAGRMQQLQNGLPGAQNEAAKQNISRELASLAGLSARLGFSTDNDISDIAKSFGDIVAGRGELKLDQNLATVLGRLQDSMDPASAAALQTVLQQTPGFGSSFKAPAAPPATGGALNLALSGALAQQGPQAAQVSTPEQMAPGFVMPFDPYGRRASSPGAMPSAQAAPQTPDAPFAQAAPQTPDAPYYLAAPPPDADAYTPPPTAQPRAVPGEKYIEGLADSAQVELDAILARQRAGERGAGIAEEIRDARQKIDYIKKNSGSALSALKAIDEDISFLQSRGDGKYAFDFMDIFSTPITSQSEYDSAMRGVDSAISKTPYVSSSGQFGPVRDNRFRARIERIKRSLEKYGEAMGFEKE